MSFTTEQIIQLRKICNTMPMAQLKKYAQQGLLSSTDILPELNPDRKREIDAILASKPNPQERAEWQNAKALADAASDENSMQQAINALRAYIDNWQSLRPLDNNVDEAILIADSLAARISDMRRMAEENDWQMVWGQAGGSINALLGHLYKYPNSIHAGEIEDAIWLELMRHPDRRHAISEYRRYFPNGKYSAECDRFQRAIIEWDEVRSNADLIRIASYIQNNPESPCLDEARSLMAHLKGRELDAMRQGADSYDSAYLLSLVNNQVFTEQELIMAHVLNYGDLEEIRNIDEIRRSLPDINESISNCRNETAEGCTDVFFFGIPSTGKSCILMGLINSTKLNYNSVHGAGTYASALSEYVNAGVTIPGTPGDFIATIQANIIVNDAYHPINLVEMSGEEFAFKLANNEDQHISFEDMGKGAPELLRNNNRKIFFIIIDPTTTNVRFTQQRPIRDEYGNVILNEEGKPITEPRTFFVNQRIMLERMIDVISDPMNKDVIDKVDAIHFIVTKADILDRTASGRDR
ncbi:MAG: hypothetical protein K2F64_04720, partial [Muribaculaceae bacterium]|nr:hypothetical protein [Muribaculaceae bacterium]